MNAPIDHLLLASLESDSPSSPSLFRASVLHTSEIGLLCKAVRSEAEIWCDWLDNGCVCPKVGDSVLVALPVDEARGIVVGLIRTAATKSPTLIIEATESLTLKCGAAQVDLRADGKVMVKGEDVLIRAKGTQRIRAGTVAIN